MVYELSGLNELNEFNGFKRARDCLGRLECLKFRVLRWFQVRGIKGSGCRVWACAAGRNPEPGMSGGCCEDVLGFKLRGVNWELSGLLVE